MNTNATHGAAGNGNHQDRLVAGAGSNAASLTGERYVRPRTVREELNAAIERHNRKIAHLIALRDTTPASILDMPQPNLAALVWPDQHPMD